MKTTCSRARRLEIAVTPYNNLGKISDNFHCNNQNNWLERRV